MTTVSIVHKRTWFDHCPSNFSSFYLLVQDASVDRAGSDRVLVDGVCSACGSGCLAVAVDPVDLVGLSDVQLVAFWNLLEVNAFVESAPEPGLPHGGVGLVPLPELALINSPGLSGV